MKMLERRYIGPFVVRHYGLGWWLVSVGNRRWAVIHCDEPEDGPVWGVVHPTGPLAEPLSQRTPRFHIHNGGLTERNVRFCSAWMSKSTALRRLDEALAWSASCS